ncbi:hypothetical protein HNW77_13085 [Komagataeibacter sp. AV436]|uniref:Uncharacterized protein n=1 Tax=Komagataeibacter melomenusus TaxID=2766578 RepID=A0ABX2AHI6_9PROT|nr:hypothetical protein [Komagataeibacter melomenusus]MBV1831545.1 hypothetical protein [Komagataeibacter melomenusus]NPC67299.1 hypothetical protein [Komagataeibacter melomenusus]
MAANGAALTIDDRATITLLLRHGAIAVRTWGDCDDPALVVELDGLHHPPPPT